MIRYGRVCRDCRGKCHDPPSEKSPLYIRCPACNGSGTNCSGCADSIQPGQIRIVDCPKEYVGGEVVSFVSLADMYKRGLPPVCGGTLDQSHSFIVACQFYFSECGYWRVKTNPLGVSDDGA